MKELMNKNKIGLTLGISFALIHALWALAIAITQTGMQKLIDWVMSLHFLDITITIEPFKLVNALILVGFAFISGYIIGYIFAAIANLIGKE